MNAQPVPSVSHASVVERLWRGVAHVDAAEAGVGAYVVVAMIAGAWVAVLIVLGALLAIEAWRHHHHRPKPAPNVDGSWRPSKGLAALVLGAASVVHSGLGRSVLWTVLGVVIVALVAYLAVGLVIDAAGGVALVAGAVSAGGLALWRRQRPSSV